MANPLTQFEIKKIVPIEVAGVDISLTNSALFMMLAVVAIFALMTLTMRNPRLVPHRAQSVAEIFYEFVAKLVDDAAGIKARPFFPFMFCVFMFVFMGNLLGLLPSAVIPGASNFTFTSHIISNLVLASVVILLCTIVGIVRHRVHFLKLFCPDGTPAFLAPIIFVIEFFSYLFRPISLSLRLFGNMLAGHIALKVFAGFIVGMGVFGFVPLAGNVALVGFELFVAFLQAYIFTLLSCVYLHDAVYLH